MSNTAITWAWNVPDLSAATKLVLLSLADHANDDWSCWPSLDRLTELTGRDRKTVCRCLDQLVEKGLIERNIGSGRRSTYYTLQWRHATTTPVDNSRSSGTTPPLAGQNATTTEPAESRSSGVTPPQGRHSDPVVVAPRHPNPKEPSCEPSSSSPANSDDPTARATRIIREAGKKHGEETVRARGGSVLALRDWFVRKYDDPDDFNDVVTICTNHQHATDDDLVRHLVHARPIPAPRPSEADIERMVAEANAQLEASNAHNRALREAEAAANTGDYRTILGKVLNHPDRFVKGQSA